MNTIGKILVILNFLFAVVLGVFLILHFAVQTQWKGAYQDLQKEFEIMKQSRIATTKATSSVLNDNRTQSGDIEKLKQDLAASELRNKDAQDVSDLRLAEAKSKLDDAALSLKELGVTNKRYVDEIAILAKAVEDRQKLIVKLEGDVKRFRVEAIAAQALAATRQIQNENLLEQIRDITREIALLRSGVNADTIAIRNPNEPNPPSVLVNGKIEIVEATDNSLVQISLGSDHGVRKNHTLDVYRVTPEAKYLGMIRIVESYQNKSVGRLVASGNAARNQLRVNDIVTSKITR